ncbi:MAG: M13 family metallopeptidase N-terminal domain-containing protein, partial [Gemmatimonadales bacterium]
MRHLRMVALLQVLTLPGLAHAQSDRPVLAVDSTHLDTTCAPCRDFYQFANGGWEDRATIPAQYSYFGTPREVEDRNEVLLRKILVDAARHATRTDDATTRLVGTFYGSCMDSALAARQGAAPLQPLLGQIAAIRSRGDLAEVIGELAREGIDAGMPFFPFADLAHSDTLRLNSWQGSYGLPDRDFYLRSDSALTVARTNYRAHLLRMFRLLGDTPARARQNRDRVWSIELALARGAVPSEEANKFPKLHHPATRAALDSLARHVEWTRLFTGLGVPGLKQLNVMIPSELTTFDSLVGASPLEEWQAYLRWRAAHFAGRYLDARFEREQLAYDRIVSGQSQLKPRWQRCLNATDEQIG